MPMGILYVRGAVDCIEAGLYQSIRERGMGFIHSCVKDSNDDRFSSGREATDRMDVLARNTLNYARSIVIN
jgi:hypothetical protein